MAKWPETKEEWIKAGYEVAVVVTGPTDYGPFHKFSSNDWELRGHIIPIETAAGAMEAYRERGGAEPCKTCFPAKAKA